MRKRKAGLPKHLALRLSILNFDPRAPMAQQLTDAALSVLDLTNAHRHDLQDVEILPSLTVQSSLGRLIF